MSAIEKLDEIEARAAAATEGPWAWDEDVWLTQDRGLGFVARPNSNTSPDVVTPLVVEHWDRAFIAHARTDVPLMASALRAVLDLVANVGNESTGPEVAYCYEVRDAIDAALAVTS